VLEVLPQLRIDSGLRLLVVPHWLLFAAAFVFFRWLGARRGCTPASTISTHPSPMP
jgi:hypothetical protein